jgi:hypothetical protein
MGYCTSQLTYYSDHIQRTATCGLLVDDQTGAHQNGETSHDGGGQTWDGSYTGQTMSLPDTEPVTSTDS